MQHADDIAFQRAILANPADTTLKLVYADWLQERDDPRAEYVRQQLQLIRDEDATKKPIRAVFPISPLQAQLENKKREEVLAKSREKLADAGKRLDPKWVGFMSSLAQPSALLTFQQGEPSHPFTEPVVRRGPVVTFESQYRTADTWDEGLLSDLAFLAGVKWGECYYGASSFGMYGFVCKWSAPRERLTGANVLAAIKAADFQSEHIATLNASAIPYPGYHADTINDEIHTEFAGQYMFSRESKGAEKAGNHGLLKRHVASGRLWYVLLHTGGRPCNVVALLAVGRSPHGNRLVGAITSQLCHNLCD